MGAILAKPKNRLMPKSVACRSRHGPMVQTRFVTVGFDRHSTQPVAMCRNVVNVGRVNAVPNS